MTKPNTTRITEMLAQKGPLSLPQLQKELHKTRRPVLTAARKLVEQGTLRVITDSGTLKYELTA